jgi:hypothetical protein
MTVKTSAKIGVKGNLYILNAVNPCQGFFDGNRSECASHTRNIHYDPLLCSDGITNYQEQ